MIWIAGRPGGGSKPRGRNGARGGGAARAGGDVSRGRREPTVVEFKAKGPHWIVMGPPLTGKTTTLRSLVLSLAHSYSPQQVAMVLVDPSDAARRFYNLGSGEGNPLDKLPHVLATVSTADELDRVVKRLVAEFDDTVRGRLKCAPRVFT